MTDNRTPPGLTAVGELMRPLIEQANELTAAVKHDGMERRRENRRIMAIALALLMLVTINVAILMQNRARSAETREIIRNSAATSERIADCTTAGGECYERSQRSAQDFLGQILIMNQYVVQCAKVTNTDDELQACVTERVKAARLTPPGDAGPSTGPSAGPTPSEAQDDEPTP